MRESASFYYIVWGIILILALYERYIKRPYRQEFVAIILMISAVIVGCRYRVGADWANYVQFYYSGSIIGNDGYERGVEPLYVFAQTIFHGLGLTHAVFFFFLSIVTLGCYYKASKLLGIKYFMTVFFIYLSLVFLNYQFNVIRQGVMAAFVWLAFAYKANGKYRACIVSLLIALGFHYTTIAFVPFIFLGDRRFSIFEVLVITMLSFTCLILDVSYKILSLFPILMVLDRTSNFVTSETFYVEGGLSFGMIVMLIVFLFVYIFFRKEYVSNPRLRMLANMILFDFMLSCMFNTFSILQERVCRVMFFSMVFLLPLIVEKIKKSEVRAIAMTIIVIYAFSAYIKTFAIHDDGYSTLLPYEIELSQLFIGSH